MRRAAAYLGVLVGASVLLGGCIPAPPPPTTVELVNSTGLDVSPELHISNSAVNAAELFTSANLVTDFTDRPFPELRGNESVLLTFECEEIQSLGVDAPVLFDALQGIVTRSDDQIFMLRDEHFECGATLRFVYSTEGSAFRVRVETP